LGDIVSGPARSALHEAVAAHAPLQIPGTVNAYSALLAQSVGFEAVYLSGAGVANASLGLPDLAMTTLPDVLEDARRITAVCSLPLLVDADTGFGSAFNIARWSTTTNCVRPCRKKAWAHRPRARPSSKAC
jgi:methylisocitrate lyase